MDLATRTSNLVVVDIADAIISDNPDDVLITYSLGSCIGVGIYDPVVGVGGLIHCMLPRIDKTKARDKPYMYVDAGMMVLLEKLFEMGVRKSRAIVKVAGGARVLDTKNLFRIGERNYTIFRKIMWKNGMIIKAEDVGGDATRTVRLEMSTGNFYVKSGGQDKEL